MASLQANNLSILPRTSLTSYHVLFPSRFYGSAIRHIMYICSVIHYCAILSWFEEFPLARDVLRAETRDDEFRDLGESIGGQGKNGGTGSR